MIQIAPNNPLRARLMVFPVGPAAQMPYVDSGPYVFGQAAQSAPGDVTSLTYGDGALHWAYSAGDDTLDSFQVLWTQTFDGKDPVWPDWAYAMTAPSLARLRADVLHHRPRGVCRPAHSANGDGSPATCDEPDMVPPAIPALNLEIDSNNDGGIDSSDDAIEANPNYPGKIIPLGDASADPNGTELRVVPNYSDSSDTVTFDFDDSALTVALPGSNGTISPEDEFTWAQLSPMFSYGVLVLHV